MPQDGPPHFDPQFPYSSLVRATDRAKVLDQLVSSIWETALGLKLSPVDDVPSDPTQKTRTAVIHLTGTWRGSVALTAATTLADECATRMYSAALDQLSSAEVQDSWGELCNMVAGNLKALVRGPSAISLPTVMEGSTFAYRVPHSWLYNELTYACHGERLRVTVLRAETATSAALQAMDPGSAPKVS
jgi:CheY-specific phosphatase CheX